MRISIGGQDYTPALDAVRPLTVERKLNEPSACECWITLPQNGSLPVPSQNQRMRVVGDDGTIYFTGYVAGMPTPQYTGLAMDGPRYRFEVRAISDEYLLDQVGTNPAGTSAGLDAGALIAALIKKTGSSAVTASNLLPNLAVARFEQQQGAVFSDNAGEIASEVRAAYRAVDGSLSLASIPGTVHMLTEGDGAFSPAKLSLSARTDRFLSNDITVCGEHEAAEYVTEFFQGDGSTIQFYLSERPFSPTSARAIIIRELFDGAEINNRFWWNTGAQGYLTLGPGGLSMQGGTGTDGQVELSWRDPIEMGGTLLLEAAGVTFVNGSNGILAALCTADETSSACTAGFQVTAEQGSGTVCVQPVVLGRPAGAAYSIDPANQYTLRLRVHCPECQRGLATYRTLGESGPISAGGEWNTAPAKMLFEIQEFVNGVAGMPVVLYDGEIANLPGNCSVVVASSISLQGSIRSVSLTDLGSGWVVTTPANGTAMTRRVGSAAQAAECRVEASGTLVFYPGFAPSAGEQVQVRYRSARRSVGRAVNSSAQQALAKKGLPSASAWIGSVTSPVPRSSQDCRNAALVLADSAARPSALWRGQYCCSSASLDGDVWPGDALEINAPSAALNGQVVVRAVKLTFASDYPDLLQYAIMFANDWAEDLAIKTSAGVPQDARLSPVISPTFAPKLTGLVVTGIAGNTVTINTGETAPAGGGFEIRRRDNSFIPGIDPDLVMRGSQPTMSFIRASASDRFYIRAFDGTTPPNYSEFSAVLIFNTPLGS